MAVCPNCGEENPDRFRLCGFCGTPLEEALPAQELRKTVTIVFSDLKGSTSLGEQLDSESLRELMTRYFEQMSAALERHGGRVEKYIGDAIMAVFGLPRAHEDDALRAVRAASEMQQALAELNEELERRWGVRLENRTGVNTGEVVAADSPTAQRLVTGDAVNVAARLEQAAGALEVLIGEPTFRLVRRSVDVEPVEPLELKGKSERVPAYRLLGVHKHRPEPAAQVAIPLVGRERELAILEASFARADDARKAQLVILTGDAGVGKSRLVEELLSRLHRSARTLRGRALAYGDGITFWPLVEVARQAAGIRDDDEADAAQEKLAALTGGRDDVLERVASMVGLSSRDFSVQELFWGARELIASLACEQPLVLVLEDLHWAEPTFLDLVEQLLASLDAPVLLLCTARPELLEARPQWPDMPGAALVALEPLSVADSEQVIDNLLGEAGIDEAIRSQIVRAADGNPLFVEQLLSMLIDEEAVRLVDGHWQAQESLAGIAIPPTIQALLASRLDSLDREERLVLDPASVIGYVFPSPALRALVPDQLVERVPAYLDSLSAKRLVRPAEEDTHRFQHALVRDTAYDALLKRTRATLHEGFVEWAERINRERGRETEFEEIIGYHLEQAYRYLNELGPLDDHGRELGRRGFTKLTSAGRRAFHRGDMRAAAGLLRRALELRPPEDPDRLAILPTLAEALMETGDFAAAKQATGEILAAHDVDLRLRADAQLTNLLVEHHVTSDLAAWRAEVVAETERLIPELDPIGAHAELAKAWRLLAFVHATVCRWGEQVEAVQHALEQARLAGDERLEARLTSGYVIGLRDGPTPVEQAIERSRALLERPLPDRQAQAIARCSLACLLAMAGEFELAREQYRHGRALLDELGGGVLGAFATIAAARVELLAQQPEQAVQELRPTFESLAAIGERYFRPLVGALLATSLLALGASNEAGEVAAITETLADPDDTETQMLLCCVGARLARDAGEFDRAVALARDAVEIMRSADAPVMLGDALIVLAETLRDAGATVEADSAQAEALALYVRKGASAEATGLSLRAQPA